MIFAAVIIGFSHTCCANPFSGIVSFFKKDLTIDVICKNHRNLIPGSRVYLSENLDSGKVLIGKVDQITLTGSQEYRVEITIKKQHKDRLYESTRFVLMGDLFSEDSTACIIAVPPGDSTGRKLLSSGAEVRGITFLEYKIETAGRNIKKMLDSAGEQNQELLDRLKEYIDTFNTEKFQKQMDSLSEQIKEFSGEQKETFRQEVLPKIKQMLDQFLEQFDPDKKEEKSREMEKKILEIEKSVET